MSRDTGIAVKLEVEPEAKPQPAASPARDSPFRILALADLRGERANAVRLADRKAVRIDRDTFDAVLAAHSPALTIAGHTITFSELDDFHPDRLVARVPLFGRLRDLRRRLDDPRGFEMAARELMSDDDADSTSRPALPPSGSLLDAMVEEVAGPAPAGTPPPRAAPRDDFAAEIRRIVEPHLLPGDDPRRSDLEARIDRAMTALLRMVLHDPAFQSLEAAWRAIFQFVRRVETGPGLGLWLLDVSIDELAADLDATRALESSVLHRRIVDEATAHGAAPWSLITCDFAFGPDQAAVSRLARLAELGRRTGAPVLAAADPALAGATGFATDPDPADWNDTPNHEWEALRRSGMARWAGLALPRFLLRVPYGEEGEPCDAFGFEEMESPPAHGAFLWGQASWACAILLAQTFAVMGAGMQPGWHQDIDGLPLHIHRDGGVAYAKPCAESVMTERAANRLLGCGLMPLASMKDQAAVRLVRFQSIAHPLAGLAGRWSH